MRYFFGAAVLAATGLALAFLVVPLVALFVHVPPGDLLHALGSRAARDAFVVSLKTSAVAHAAVLAIGTPAAYALARYRFRGRQLVLTLIELPLVLPPAVAGVALLVTFGRFGLLGRYLSPLGIELPFTTVAVVMAQMFVSSPFFINSAKAGLEQLDSRYEMAAYTLRASPFYTFRRVVLPLIRPALLAGAGLAWARALGELGATITFAGNFPGTTETTPIAVYIAAENDLDSAVSLAVVLLAISFAVLLALRIGRSRIQERL